MSLELRQVSKVIDGETHIHPTDVILERGIFNILLGTTLAGKSSLMHLMAGLEKPTTGEIWFDGQNVTGRAVQKRNVSMVYQQFINYPNMSVYENIASPLRVARLDKAEIKRRVGSISEILRISDMLDRRPSELSGGQQQRTAMARALVKDSDLILLDEPLANLDFKLREELREELPRLFAEKDCVVVYATTEPTEALLFGGKTAAMYQGRIMDFGPTSQIYRHPADLTCARIFSEPPINVADVTKTNGMFHINEDIFWPVPAALKSLSEGAYKVGLRPHNISPRQQSAAAIKLQGTVQVAELSGSESIVHFDAYGNSWISLSHGVHPFAAGEQATLYADMTNCLYFDTAEQLIPLTEIGGH